MTDVRPVVVPGRVARRQVRRAPGHPGVAVPHGPQHRDPLALTVVSDFHRVSRLPGDKRWAILPRGNLRPDELISEHGSAPGDPRRERGSRRACGPGRRGVRARALRLARSHNLRVRYRLCRLPPGVLQGPRDEARVAERIHPELGTDSRGARPSADAQHRVHPVARCRRNVLVPVVRVVLSDLPHRVPGPADPVGQPRVLVGVRHQHRRHSSDGNAIRPVLPGCGS